MIGFSACQDYPGEACCLVGHRHRDDPRGFAFHKRSHPDPGFCGVAPGSSDGNPPKLVVFLQESGS